MGMIPVQSQDTYREAIRALFPPGEFWDRQFADPDSDLSIWCDAKAAELARLQERRSDLFDESVIDTTTELIDSWERVHGLSNRGLPIESRRGIIRQRRIATVKWGVVANTIAQYGGSLVSYGHPYRPSIFGFSRFGDRFATPAAFNVIHLEIDISPATRPDMEEAVTAQLMAYHIIGFLYV